MFAPPPQPQSRTFASGASFKKRRPQPDSARCPTFIIKTISFPPKPVGLRVFSKKDISKPPQTCSSTMILFEIFRTAGSLSRSL